MGSIANDIKPTMPLDPPHWLKSLHGAYRDLFDRQFEQMQDTIADIIQDGLQQVIPIVLVSGQDITTMRHSVGRAVWRKIHHASEQTNFLRSLIWLRFQSEATWAEIVELPEEHLRSCRNAIDWSTAKLASRLAEPGRFLQTAMLYRNVVKMGGQQSQEWSLAKLKREHARLSVQTAISDADPHDWCVAFQTECDGFEFSRLTSDRDFVVEGKSQRHCVATMCEDAKEGTVAVLRCTGSERATVLINEDGTIEIGGFANGDVSERCMRAAEIACAAFRVNRSSHS